MNQEKKETTALVTSVGADAGQPLSKSTKQIAAERLDEINTYDPEYAKILREALRMDDPAYLHTVSLNELYENVYKSRPPIIEGLLYAGTYLFVGAPKVGKSFLMAQLAYHVSMGIPLWNYSVRKGTVLYLALEDDFRRLQERLFRMFGTNGTEKLRFAICAKQVDHGLDEQLQKFKQIHPDTRLIIIDTLQKVRESVGDQYSYAKDYEIVGKLKRFADRNGICLLLVHHTRKQHSDDKFDMISGTNGLLGCADGAFVLQKKKRTSNQAVLDISGRDQQDQQLHLLRDLESLTWQFEKAETELRKEAPEPILEAIAVVVTQENPEWSGTPTELVNKLGIDIKPNTLSLKLNVNAGRLLDEHRIHYESSRNHFGRNIRLWLEFVEA